MQKYGLQIAKCKLQISNSQPKTRGIDCMALASFTHTHTTYLVCTPPLPAKRGNWRRAKKKGSQAVFRRLAQVSRRSGDPRTAACSIGLPGPIPPASKR